MPYSTSLTSTLLFLSIFILSFFPNLFITLVKLPLLPFLGPSPASTPPSTLPYCASLPDSKMSFSQRTISLPSRSRGVYLITPHITSSVPEIKDYRVGILHLFIQHTSCALSLNENWDDDTRKDMGDALDRMVPEDVSGKGIYRHDAEGSDDMPVCASVVGEGSEKRI